MAMNEDVLKYLKKTYGAKSVSMASSLAPVERFSTGILPIDIAYGGGFPVGRNVEIFGPPGLGKSTLALNICQCAQDQGMGVLYVDAEARFEKEQGTLARLDLDTLPIIYPTSGDEGFNMVRDTINLTRDADENPTIKLVVIDSIPYMEPSGDVEKYEKDAKDKSVGGVASLLSRMKTPIKKHNLEGISYIFLNQVRAKIGPMAQGVGTPGGFPREHLMSHRIHLTYAKHPAKLHASHIETFFKVVKSSFGGAGSIGSLHISQGQVQRGYALVETAKTLKLMLGSGWLKFSPEMAELTGRHGNFANGSLKAAEALEADPELYRLVYNKCLEVAMGLSGDVAVEMGLAEVLEEQID